MLAGLNGVLLGRESKCVVSHRVQDVVAPHAPEARERVGRDVAERVPHVQPLARGVGEHVENEVGVARGQGAREGADRVIGVEGSQFLPAVLPLRLNLAGELGGVALRRGTLRIVAHLCVPLLGWVAYQYSPQG